MIKWILVFLVIIASVFINGSPFIFGDGYGYYHSAKSLITEGTFTSTVEPSYYKYTGHAVSLDDNGNYTTIYPVGNALFWVPGLTVSKAISQTPNLDYFTVFNGHIVNDGIAILVTATLATFASIFLIFKTLRRIGFSEKTSFVSVLSVYLAMYVFSYLFYFSSYSHIYEIFAFSLLIYLFQKILLHDGRAYEFVFGVSIGILTLTRLVDFVIVIPFLIYFLFDRRFKTLLFTILGGIPMASILFFYNHVVYGSILSFGYSENRGGMLSTENFNLFQLLFSDVRGLFVWSPLLILSIIGLILGLRKFKALFVSSILSVILLAALYTFWPNWWGGDSLGQRFFLVLSPIFILGIARFIQVVAGLQSKPIRILIYSLILVLTAYSTLVQVLYRVTPVKELHTDAISLDSISIPSEERFTPFDILNYHSNVISEVGISTEYLKTVFNSFNGGRSLILLSMGQTDPLVKATAVGNIFKLTVVPNTNGILPQDLKVNFRYLNNHYTVSGFPQIASEINIICDFDICVSDISNISRSSMNSGTYTVVNSEFDIQVQSASRVNLVNRKLK